MKIRNYQTDDLPELLSSWERASKLAHPFLSEEFLLQERKNIPEIYLPNADTWVAEFDGKVVGFIALIGNEIGGLFVQPAYHRRGIGTALIKKAQEIHSNLEVKVFTRNSIGQNFYFKHGFEFKEETSHKETGQPILHLVFPANK
ncbi:GNAT family N-acetyltransferase [Roseofilum sp. BLCC_M91]|uniref:GNAT family N-acetyltransferase n=1 Tax=Roseofilum halophilum BLCC-M91 TaxID=3022259 RepID=A0ABT7BP65_9CYAN|nr:GNAT family N-acetyltransferase [Roseofilum halophilum]MDJ1180562.1 GNAT family N-acetyltransferase [Roseofilum halophilum BLCC-M91]